MMLDARLNEVARVAWECNHRAGKVPAVSEKPAARIRQEQLDYPKIVIVHLENVFLITF